MSSTNSSHRAPTSDSKRRDYLHTLLADRAGREWCLFLDRDGVINRRIVDDYVRSWREFEWLPDAKAALAALCGWAPHVVVVTNQQGIGKGLMSADSVARIHANIQAELAAFGVAVDDFAVCPHLESEHCRCRKPQPGLILDWLERHPSCQPSLSVMVGDSRSDLELARNVAVTTGGCAGIEIGNVDIEDIADVSFDSLWEFATAVTHQGVIHE